MKTRTRNFRKSTESHNFWPAFTDVMSTVALVLFVLILIAYIQQIVAGNTLRAFKENLEQTQSALANTESELDERKLEITKKKDELRLLQNELEQTQAEVEQGQKELMLSAKILEEQQKVIANSNEELGNLRAKLQNIAVLRLDILRQVKESIENEIGETAINGKNLVTIGDNANLVINDSVVFGFGSAEISPNGKDLLDQFAVAFEKVLDNDSIRDNIDSINIEGHTDYIDDWDANRKLSSLRADNVVNYLMKSNPALESRYGEFFAATGFSEFRPIDPGTTEAARSKNRRIEISINIKDSNVQRIINEYLNDTEEILQNGDN